MYLLYVVTDLLK